MSPELKLKIVGWFYILWGVQSFMVYGTGLLLARFAGLEFDPMDGIVLCSVQLPSGVLFLPVGVGLLRKVAIARKFAIVWSVIFGAVIIGWAVLGSMILLQPEMLHQLEPHQVNQISNGPFFIGLLAVWWFWQFKVLWSSESKSLCQKPEAAVG